MLLRHTKTHLWAEYERTHFRAGAYLPPLCVWRGLTVACVICYEVEFAEMVRHLGAHAVQLVLCPTAVAACYEALGLLAERVLPTRAFENNL